MKYEGRIILVRTLQSSIHHFRNSARPRLCDDDPDGDANSAGDAEGGEVGEEDEIPSFSLDELQTDTEGDDELVAGDGWNYNTDH